MIQYSRGIKAGLLASFVFVVITIVFEFTGISEQYWLIVLAAGLNISTGSGMLHPEFALQTIAIRIVGGIVFGAVFAALYDYLPRGAGFVKAVLLSLFLWTVSLVGLIYLLMGWPAYFAGGLMAWGGAVTVGPIDTTLVGIASTLVFGALTGAIWMRMRGKEVVEARKGTAVLLVSFIWGVVGWVHFTLIYILFVGFRGAPFPFLGGEWWEILVASTVFLGLAGLILLLLAWRITRRGESGFMLSLAGGAIMTLTGLSLLLPGVLAIIGGVLSRREPTTEVSTVESGQ